MTDLKALHIYINSREFEGSADQLNEFIKQNAAFQSWWNFIPFVYVVLTKETPAEVRDRIKRFVGEDCDIMVVTIDPTEVSMRLPGSALEAFATDIADKFNADYDVIEDGA